MKQLSNKVHLKHIWKIFGPNPQHVFKTMDPKASRHEIRRDMGHVIGVRDVSFDVAESEIFVVMGLSGSGKSTLVRCLSRLIEPTAGQVIINDVDVTAMNDHALRELRRNQVSMVFQRFGLFPHRRVVDNVAYGLEVQGMGVNERRAQAREILDLVGLSGWDSCFPHELSGGMQQRVGLARALAVDPELMLCDEPFSALDPLIRRDMQNELLSLQKRLRKTIIFITHDFAEAIKLGDRIAIMKDGEIVQIGTPQQIVANPINSYVREFTQDVPRGKVLTAVSVMRPLANATKFSSHTIPHSTTLEALIPQIIESDKLLPVVDDNDSVIGVLDRRDVLMAMTESQIWRS